MNYSETESNSTQLQSKIIDEHLCRKTVFDTPSIIPIYNKNIYLKRKQIETVNTFNTETHPKPAPRKQKPLNSIRQNALRSEVFPNQAPERPGMEKKTPSTAKKNGESILPPFEGVSLIQLAEESKSSEFFAPHERVPPSSQKSKETNAVFHYGILETHDNPSLISSKKKPFVKKVHLTHDTRSKAYLAGETSNRFYRGLFLG